MATNTPTAPAETCCPNPEDWVVNGATETVCHNCMTRKAAGFVPTVSVEENQTR